MIPSEPEARFRSLTQQALADGICDAAVLIRYEALWREPQMRSERWVAHQNEKIARALAVFEAEPPEELSNIGTDRARRRARLSGSALRGRLARGPS